MPEFIREGLDLILAGYKREPQEFGKRGSAMTKKVKDKTERGKKIRDEELERERLHEEEPDEKRRHREEEAEEKD